MKIKTQWELINLVAVATKAKHFDIYERSLLLALARRINPKKNWTCWPSVETLCEDSCMKKSKFHTTLSSLVERKIVQHERRKLTSSVYSLNTDVLCSFVSDKTLLTKNNDDPFVLFEEDDDEWSPF